METLQRLRWHAGLEEYAGGDGAALADALWRKGGIDDSVADVMRCFEKLNLEINGEKPSETIASGGPLPRALVYTITEILRRLQHSALQEDDLRVREARFYAGWQLQTCWAAILAGDIDNISEHLSFEEAALN